MTRSTQRTSQPVVLLAEDDPETRLALRNLFRSTGLPTVACANGKEAIALLRAADFDVVVTDIEMPEVDGLHLIDWIRSHRPHLRTIVISGHSDERARRAVTSRGVAARLPKPFDPGLLVQLVRDEDSSSNLVGDPGALDLLEYLVTLVRTKRTAVLELVAQDGGSGNVYVDRGQLVHASYDGTSGEDAVVHASRARGLSCRILPWREPEARTIATASEIVLMRAAHFLERSTS